jgi:hypothetical protein
MKYKVALRKTEEGFSVFCRGLSGCWTQGKTEQEALVLFPILIRKPPAIFAGNLPPVMSLSGEAMR